MLSNFGLADGGRETWARNFIPRLLDRYPELRLRILGLRVEGEPDNRATVLSSVPEADRDRLSIDFVSAKKGRGPNALAFWRGLPRVTGDDSSPAFVLAVGSWVEVLAVLLSRGFRSSGKLVWLRSIFADEKAHRYPRFLRPLLERIEDAVLRRADIIIANGEDTAAHYRKRGFTVHVIPNGVDIDRWRMKPPAIETPVKVAYVGRLAGAKGIDDVVGAARAAKQRGLDWLAFHVIGGPRLPSVDQAHSEGWLDYHGAVSNEWMPQALSEMHICVALTYVRGEGDDFSGGGGVSNALLEQMASGRIIVAWDNAAFRQVLDEQSAFLVPQGDRRALLDALIQIHEDPRAAEERSRKAAEVAEQYSFESHLDLFASAADRWLSPGGVKAE
jgi:glycosyltransferase involved in cell wall biosynthesis